MGLEKEPPTSNFVIPRANYERAVELVNEGESRFIFAFMTPDNNIAYRMTAGQIVDAVNKGQMEVI